jgi:formylglycine-generating enzyme required for sulfatase activity
MAIGPDAAFCVDSTEVTNAQFDAFLVATGGGKVDSGVVDGGVHPGCTTVTTFNRLAPSGGPAQPVAQITWCAAESYCRWAGKRLCGGTHNVSNVGEWWAVCSGNGQRIYPYGSTYVAGACNDTSGVTENVGTRTGCEGGVSGVVDMTGNVAEFIQACTVANDSCMAAGGGPTGGFLNNCGQGGFYAPSVTANANTGFRCCAAFR